MVMIHNPGNEYPINELYAYVSVDANGNEGIIGHGTATGAWFPLVTGNRELAMSLMETAREAGELAGEEVVLVKFTHKQVVRTVYRNVQ